MLIPNGSFYQETGGNWVFVVSDRVSVFDAVVGTIPFKGQVLNTITAWWMDQVSHILPHHMLGCPRNNFV